MSTDLAIIYVCIVERCLGSYGDYIQTEVKEVVDLA